jgi:hypothetical protein
MIGFSTLNSLFDLLLNTKVGISKIYHSVIIRPTQDGRKPGAPVGKAFVYVGVDDTEGFSCYCRQVEPMSVNKTERKGSCSTKIFHTRTLHRIVFFHDHEKKLHDDLLSVLIKAVIASGVELSKVHTNHEEILKAEAPTGRFTFQPSTFYAAIDFYLILELTADNCPTEIRCEGLPNPYC